MGRCDGFETIYPLHFPHCHHQLGLIGVELNMAGMGDQRGTFIDLSQFNL